jgi:squalene cyclase
MDVVPEGLAPLLAESTRHELAALDRLMEGTWRRVLARRDAWGGAAAGVDPVRAARVLRAAGVVGARSVLADEIGVLVDAQGDDGGFAPATGSSASRVTAAARCAAALLVSGAAASSARVDAALARAIDFVLGQQTPEGGWCDDVDARARATALAVGLLAEALGRSHAHRAGEVADAWRAGVRWLCSQQRPDGLWSDGARGSTSSAIGATALILLEGLAPARAGVGSDDRVASARRGAVAALLRAQDEDGSWGEDVERSIGCTRAAMRTLELARAGDGYGSVDSGCGDAPAVVRAAERGMAWLLAAMGEDGWSESRGAAASAEVTADALVLLREYRDHRCGLAARSGSEGSR